MVGVDTSQGRELGHAQMLGVAIVDDLGHPLEPAGGSRRPGAPIRSAMQPGEQQPGDPVQREGCQIVILLELTDGGPGQRLRTDTIHVHDLFGDHPRGIISDSNAGFIEIGSVSYFYARDNGEGSAAPADIVSTARINDVEGEDRIFCADRPLLLPSFPIQYGNVQVR